MNVVSHVTNVGPMCFVRIVISFSLYSCLVYNFTYFFLADRTNGRGIGTLLRPSVVVVVCDVMYCG